MGMVKVLVDQYLGIMVCFSRSLFHFMIMKFNMNCIDYIMYMLCTGLWMSYDDYGHYGPLWSIMVLAIRKTQT
jgi:hypothetical protein